MKHLHLFNPENDLALARNLANYTPPPAAAALASAGATLPIWYGEEGDAVMAGANEEWAYSVRRLFGVQADIWDSSPEGYAASPWGWSKAVRSRFLRAGFTPLALPSDSVLDSLRILSSRRSACCLGKSLSDAGLLHREFVPEEIRSTEEAREYCRRIRDALFKLPWSSSGRGQIRVSGREDFAARESAIEGALRRYGFLTAEPFHRDKAVDLALLFEAFGSGSAVEFAGFSLFTTAPNGDYTGNVLASDAEIRRRLESGFPGISRKLDEASECLRSALSSLLDGKYSGPMGVDMMIISDGTLINCVELNLRMTMGHVARRFHDRYCAPESSGRFVIRPEAPSRNNYDTAIIRDRRLREGRLSLNPAGDFTFEVII